MEVIKGGYKKGRWFHDPDAYTDEEIEYANEAFRRLGKFDRRWLKLIWKPKKDKRQLRRVTQTTDIS